MGFGKPMKIFGFQDRYHVVRPLLGLHDIGMVLLKQGRQLHGVFVGIIAHLAAHELIGVEGSAVAFHIARVFGFGGRIRR
jgi:hypothetical protein